MSDLVAFVRARLAEDEAAARPLIGMPGALTAFGPVAQFIASSGPARVLREVEAMRAIVDVYEEQDSWQLPDGVHDGRDWDERESDAAIKVVLHDLVLRPIARIWRDHPDYKPLRGEQT